MTGQNENLLCIATERLSYGWIDPRALYGDVGVAEFRGDTIPIVFNGVRFEPCASWSNPYPYGKIRAA